MGLFFNLVLCLIISLQGILYQTVLMMWLVQTQTHGDTFIGHKKFLIS